MKIIFCLLATFSSVVLAAPFDKLGDLSWYSYPQIIGGVLEASPVEVHEFLNGIPQEEYRKFEKEFPDYIKKRKIIVTTKTISGIIRDISPATLKKFKNLISILKAKFNRLSQPTQAFIKKSINEVDAGLIYYQTDLKIGFDHLTEEAAKKVSIRLFHILRNIVQYLEANPKAKAEIAEQWPNYGKLFDSPWYKPLQTMASIAEDQIEPLIDTSMDYKKREYGS